MYKRTISLILTIVLLFSSAVSVAASSEPVKYEGFTYNRDLEMLGDISLDIKSLNKVDSHSYNLTASIIYNEIDYSVNVLMKKVDQYEAYHGEGDLLLNGEIEGNIIISSDNLKRNWSGIINLKNDFNPIFFVVNNEKIKDIKKLRENIASKNLKINENISEQTTYTPESADANLLKSGYFGNYKYYGEFIGSPSVGVHANVYGARVRLTQDGYDFFSNPINGQDPRYAKIRLKLSNSIFGKGPMFEAPCVYPNGNSSSSLSISLSYQFSPYVSLSVSWTPSSTNYSAGAFDSWSKVNVPSSLSDFTYTEQYDENGTGVNYVIKMQGSTPDYTTYYNTGYMYISVYNYYDHYYFDESASFSNIPIRSDM